ncbi:MAG: hypothetical protein ACTJGQ_10605, partial [Agrococcus casei]|uniref:hypothetical protein n=1 Tax=Agrococcus casei TaxID=343512 RepID=UPI003F8FD1FE
PSVAIQPLSSVRVTGASPKRTTSAWWSHGGRTDLDNGINLCNFHHHQVHQQHLDIVRDPPTQKWKAVRVIRR